MGDEADWLMDRAFDEWCELGCPPLRAPIWVKTRDDEWRTSDGKVFKIKKLKTGHLCNILNYIQGFKKERAVGRERMIRLRSEANKRGLTRGADGFYREPHGFTKIA